MMCPCCNQPINADRASMDALVELRLTSLELAVLQTLIDAYPRYVQRGRLIDAVWGDDIDGGPENATNILFIVSGRLRKKIEPYGWTISRNVKGLGSQKRHRLEPYHGD